MTTDDKKYGTVLLCMDGKYILESLTAAKEQLGINYPDCITEPGLDGLLGGAAYGLIEDAAKRAQIEAWVIEKVKASHKLHETDACMIIGHESCGGNPGALEGHYAHLRVVRDRISALGLFDRVEIAVINATKEVTLVPEV